MDIWEKMYEEAKKLYDPHEVSPFVYANHVVAAIEAEDGKIYIPAFALKEPVVFFISALKGQQLLICISILDRQK